MFRSKVHLADRAYQKLIPSLKLVAHGAPCRCSIRNVSNILCNSKAEVRVEVARIPVIFRDQTTIIPDIETIKSGGRCYVRQ